MSTDMDRVHRWADRTVRALDEMANDEDEWPDEVSDLCSHAAAVIRVLQERVRAAGERVEGLLDLIYVEAGEHNPECFCWMCDELKAVAATDTQEGE